MALNIKFPLLGHFPTFLGLLLVSQHVNASVLLQFSNGGVGATNFADASGQVTDNMLWGVVIDSAGDGFSTGSYDSFDVSSSSFLSVNGVATNDYYFFTNAYTLTLDTPFYTGVEAGSGGVTSTSGVPSTGDGVSGVAAGDSFALIWFPALVATPGGSYGFFTDDTFVLPASGTEAFSSPFTGQDPIRSATYTFSSIPEPTKGVLCLMGFCAVWARRKRNI